MILREHKMICKTDRRSRPVLQKNTTVGTCLGKGVRCKVLFEMYWGLTYLRDVDESR